MRLRRTEVVVSTIGVLCLCAGAALPWQAAWRASRAAAVKEQVIDQSELRPALVVLPTGSFLMGSSAADAHTLAERPQHKVAVSKRFAMAETEVTQGQYQAVVGTNPSFFKEGPDWKQRPVENVSWLDAIGYCNELSKQEGLAPCYKVQGDEVKWEAGQDCPGYRLPTEAEWEYAARAGQSTKYAGSDDPKEVAWFAETVKDERTQVVKQKKANAWFLYDLSGNVWEWVWDYLASYQAGPKQDPAGPSSGMDRVGRGGSWDFPAWRARVAVRLGNDPGDRSRGRGFRLVRSYP